MDSDRQNRGLVLLLRLLGFLVMIGVVVVILMIGTVRYAKLDLHSLIRGTQQDTKINSSYLFYEQIGRIPEGFVEPQEVAVLGGENERVEQFTLEMSVVESREIAEKKIAELSAKGILAFFTPYNRSGHVVYRIRQGIFASESEAKVKRDQVEKRFKMSSRVVKL